MTKGNYVVFVGQQKFEIALSSQQSLQVDGKELDFDFKPLHDRSFSLILGGRSYVVEHVAKGESVSFHSSDPDSLLGKAVVVSIRGKEFTVLIDDTRSMLLKKFSTKASVGSGAHVVRAPMPGLISRVAIQVGEEVTDGQGLLVLEAMKMENEIRATGRARVKAIHAEKGKVVEKGEPLITLEEA